MTKPVSTLTTFAGQSGPVPLNQLDTNLSNLAATANDTLTYENYVLDTGAANAYVVTFGAGISVAYQAGLRIVFKAGASNTTASNINVNTLGAQLIVNKDGSALVANQIVAGGLATIIYNGTNFELVTPNPNVKTDLSGLFGVGASLSTSWKPLTMTWPPFPSTVRFPPPSDLRPARRM